jgi:O-antigen ligase
MAYPLAAAAVCLTLIVRPAIFGRENWWIDLALVVYLTFVVLQRIPLPPLLRLRFSPALRAVDLQLRIGAPVLPSADTPHALSVNPEGTTLSILVSVAVVLTFWCARAIFARGGVRLAARAVAAMGLALAAFGIAQHTTAPHTFYWTTVVPHAAPFGPYLNHSDFATWLVMGLSLTGGYLIARLHSRQALSGGPTLSVDAFDNRAMWLTTAAGVMAAALMVGLSRSGLIAEAAAVASLWMMSKGRIAGRGRLWLLAGLAAVAVVAVAFTNTTAVAGRIEETIAHGIGGRSEIWRATWPMVKDFWLTGIGAGAFERGMMVYQPAPHETYFNHAHNDYLQLLSEGGVLLALPAIVVAWAGVRLIRERLRGDRSSIYWIRAGAVSGLVAVAVQSIWETGLRVPANTLLFAVLAGIATHSAPQSPSRD